MKERRVLNDPTAVVEGRLIFYQTPVSIILGVRCTSYLFRGRCTGAPPRPPPHPSSPRHPPPTHHPTPPCPTLPAWAYPVPRTLLSEIGCIGFVVGDIQRVTREGRRRKQGDGGGCAPSCGAAGTGGRGGRGGVLDINGGSARASPGGDSGGWWVGFCFCWLVGWLVGLLC